ncbi:hypothetical protein B842_01590 [Corynebacterium humireducens NBRC 106098 = DSM 45392]|uniref:Uncharacterized protein n=1 Tax=Corynebacterium humireducens NBRC 106098 = DSM 45392 TaxID=1223515 RepID=A0A0B5D8S1_9CORY|nr:hypothetical protein [Corynebacterium humireducens]AJE32174.1 hypothetical protein B842_01590 [Corynebacterium humireducens NBRC 106098 = DSM 45392]
MSDDTRYLGPTGADGEPPRQYFPSEQEQQWNQQQPDYQQYMVPETPQPAASRSGGALPLVMGILFGLTLLAAGLFFFLWRNAAAELAKPVPPVTVTQTTSVTVTETTTALPPIPTELPTELPEIDVEGWLNDLLGSR